ncbi:MAG: HDOD domain-containing protein [Rubrivivax sp.]|nr:HDOD domain-containing protein [Rubrivivax sp.]MDP3224041.1 HDOD domain-containing protein [Rubrivivax sp.]
MPAPSSDPTAAGASPAAPSAAPAPARGNAVRWFGRLQLLKLLGKSELTMAWRVTDPRSGQELVLVLPRVQPADAVALELWQQAVRQASRLSHPRLAAVVEVGVQDGWPYVAYDPRDAATLQDRATRKGLPGTEAAELTAQTLRGLAFAHEAGVSHHDLQPYLVLVSDSGQVRVAGLAVAAERAWQRASGSGSQTAPGETATLRLQREAAERDVLAVGVLLHGLLVGTEGQEEADIGKLIQRLPPHCGPVGRDSVRLPWTSAHPIAEPLRAIANRSTDRQERQRYRNARTLLRALEGWLQTESSTDGGPLALLADKMRVAGVLPSSPGAAARAARLTLMERERTNELAEVVLEDLALSFELLRLVNTAQVRGAQVAGSGPVLTVRRAIAMLGLDGVRRAALALRDWPGPLAEEGAKELTRQIERCRKAGRVALALRPAGYDGEVVYLITLLQNLGRLVVRYHFADEAQQIHRLMQAVPSSREGEPDEAGMAEEAAAYAVLGTDIEAIGAAVARHWGLDDSVLAMIRRMPTATPVRSLDSDDDLLRGVASCANEAVDALSLPAPRVLGALQRVVQRYGRALNLHLRDLQAALQGGSAPPAEPIAQTMPAPLDLLEEHPPTAAGGLRQAAAARASGGAAH